MAENTYNLNSVWKATSSNKDSLTLSAFNGRMGLTVWQANERSPSVKFPLCPEAVQALRNAAIAIRDSKGPAKEPLQQTKYNQDTKSFDKIAQFMLIRDERGAVTIEVSGVGISPSIVFNIKAPGSFNIGGDGLSAVDRSNLTLDALIDILQQAPTIAALSTFNQQPRPAGGQQRGGNGGGGGGGQRSNQDDMPF